MPRINFSSCKLSGLDYGGAEKKIGILFNDHPFMLKFAKKNAYGSCFNDASEYLCSRIFQMVGLPVQTALLGHLSRRKCGCLQRLSFPLTESENLVLIRTCLVSVIEALAAGDTITLDGLPLNGTQRILVFKAVYPLFRKMKEHKELIQKQTVDKRKANGSYRGRKPKAIDPNDFKEISFRFRQKEINLNDALKMSGVSRSTFCRLLKKYRNKTTHK